ncbi:MAG: PEP-CTERM sorting domain-containing protein [Planctomycetota bacterium]|jgi:hypothetical protein
MKKLLVLMLVLGMTSVSSATITSLMNIQDDGGGAYSIQIPNLNNVADGLGGYWALVGDAANPLTGGAIAATIPAIFGPTSSIFGDASGTGYFAAGIGIWGSFGTTTPTYSTAPAVFADNFAWVDSGMYSGPEITLTLHTISDDFMTLAFNSDYTIPEPMTIALLGFGGLFLLRRRK